MKVPLDAVIIRERVREEIGSLDSLMKSLDKHGQLNPITITRENELVAGHRRLLAAQELGWQYIDVSIVDGISDIEKLELELEENIHRKDFLPEEVLAGYSRLQRLRKPTVRKRFARFFVLIFSRIFRRRKPRLSDTPSPRSTDTAPTATPTALPQTARDASDPYSWQES